MTTELKGTLARQIIVGSITYKVELTPTGIRITEKRKRRGHETSWATLLALGSRQRTAPAPRDATELGNASVNADVAREIRNAVMALEKAKQVIKTAGGLPGLLVKEAEADEVHGRTERQDDWFVEPLLTPVELASILRVPLASVRSLDIPSLLVHGETRYRQSAVREFFRRSERSPLGSAAVKTNPQRHGYPFRYPLRQESGKRGRR